MTEVPAGKVKANPTKAFFVRMLTRDISLEDCILDLIDNSIDGAWRSAGVEPSELVVDDALAGYHIALQADEDAFSISDNCGGIARADAVNYAFTFGRGEDREPGEYSVGVYGIGMKRAVFKLGETIEITSTHVERDNMLSFRVPIHVPTWLAEDQSNEWDFDLEDVDPAPAAGLVIRVTDLTAETRNRLQDPTYVGDLLNVLSRDYMVPLLRGLNISVNGQTVPIDQITLRESGDFLPMREHFMDGEVRVEILAGMRTAPPEDREPVDRPADEPSGWYVLCNGRAVVAGDTTEVTGWGDDFPQWHQQYAGFVGIVLFSAKDPELLPMTTTKRNVDESSGLYRRALVRMKEAARIWIDYTNARKTDPEPLRELEAQTTAVPISTLPERPRVVVPIRVPVERARNANVHYVVPLQKINRLSEAFGSLAVTYRDVGLASFDYSYENLVDESE